ncbi:MAG: ABC transporter permease [Desulfobacterales bacterium]
MTEIHGERVSAATSDPARRLVVLPFNKSVEISFKNIRVRFFRSMITTLSLVLAVSFLCFTNVGMNVADGLLAGGDPDQRQALISAGYDIGPQDTSVAATAKQRWIVILSLVVCVVGIINAQLMAVTERFREIGTMKCLGALDRFILRLFFLEAGMQGLAGGAIGAVAGAFFSLVSATASFGTVALAQASWTGVARSVLSATLVGFFLSLVGVFYPAIVAAKMQPVEAMRTEH